MNEDVYAEINVIVSNYIYNKYHNKYIKDLDVMIFICELLISSMNDFDNGYIPYSEKVNINDSISIIESFLSELNPLYQMEFNSIMHETYVDDNGKKIPTIEFARVNSPLEDESNVDITSVSTINYTETLYDVFTLVHEMFHEFNLEPNNEDDYARDILTETISITSEFLLEDYLIKEGICTREASLNKHDRFTYSYISASKVIFESTLINLYLKNGKISNEIINEYINSLDKKSITYHIFNTYYNELLIDILNNKTLNFVRNYRYVLGVVLASDIHNRILESEDNKDILFNMNHRLPVSNALKSILKDADLDFYKRSKNKSLVLNDRIVSRLMSSLNSELNGKQMKKSL